tara:strand:+ start:303 stop:551 length:249 start_codon:yes stop_codon:yes gene_type:complete
MEVPPVDTHTVESVSPLKGGLGKQDGHKDEERDSEFPPIVVTARTGCENPFALRQTVLFQPVVGIDGVIETLRMSHNREYGQ